MNPSEEIIPIHTEAVEEFYNLGIKQELKFFIDQVKQNPDKLAVGIRGNYINIYYRGGNLLRTKPKRKDYELFFDCKYCKNKADESNLKKLSSMETISDYKENFVLMMDEMDSWFEEHPKKEREYQQNLLMNNPEIIDIEYQIGKKMRLDMLMVVGDTLIIVENKYGIGAIGGNSGIKDHYEDMSSVFDDSKIFKEMEKSIYAISDAKFQLGLSSKRIEQGSIKKKEILFLLAGFNTRSQAVNNEIKAIKRKKYPARILYKDTSDCDVNWVEAQILFDDDKR